VKIIRLILERNKCLEMAQNADGRHVATSTIIKIENGALSALPTLAKAGYYVIDNSVKRLQALCGHWDDVVI
jgi:hypothetical protein